jgi:hypothetical protein
MKKQKVLGILILAGCIVIIFWGLKSLVELAIIKYGGQKVSATIVEVPSSCDRYNFIKVVFTGTTHEVNISKTNCRNGLYKVGQQVTLLKHRGYDDLIWPGSYPELVIVLIIAVLIFAYFNVKKYF